VPLWYAQAKWYEQFGIIGLEEESLSFLLQKASLFVRRTEELAKILSELKRKYSAFFNWLLAGTISPIEPVPREIICFLICTTPSHAPQAHCGWPTC
jgi:hypothetical protein